MGVTDPFRTMDRFPTRQEAHAEKDRINMAGYEKVGGVCLYGNNSMGWVIWMEDTLINRDFLIGKKGEFDGAYRASLLG